MAVILLNKIIVLVCNILYPFLVSGEFGDHDPRTCSIQLSPEGEVNSGGYIPRREASRYISTTILFVMYTTDTPYCLRHSVYAIVYTYISTTILFVMYTTDTPYCLRHSVYAIVYTYISTTILFVMYTTDTPYCLTSCSLITHHAL